MSEQELEQTETPDETPDTPDAPDDDEQAEDDEQNDEPEPESVPEPEQRGITEEQYERAAKDSEKAWNRYATGVVGRFGAYAENLIECPLCTAEHKGFVDTQFAGRIPDEITRGIMLYLGLQREKDYKQSSQHSTCSECDGDGKVKTGSKVPGNEAIRCPVCKGTGFAGPQEATVTANGHATPESVAEVQDGPPDDQVERDNWGEPRILPDGRENPNYGKQPQFKILVEPWGHTANLTAQDAYA
jgi:hypothetical protein